MSNRTKSPVFVDSIEKARACAFLGHKVLWVACSARQATELADEVHDKIKSIRGVNLVQFEAGQGGCIYFQTKTGNLLARVCGLRITRTNSTNPDIIAIAEENNELF